MTVLKLCIVALNAVMAVRAFQAGTITDRLLGAVLITGLVLLFTTPVSFAACWLIACAGAYLISQILTSARLLSRGLPVLAGLLAGVLCWISW